jgi:hypothetical protein
MPSDCLAITQGLIHMAKLIARYKTTLAKSDLEKLVRYHNRHPFASMFLSDSDQQWLKANVCFFGLI